MTLQASGAISLLNISDEFGGIAPDSISEYYRGGANVPDIGENSGIPTAGTIKFTDFYGGVKPVLALSGGSFERAGASGPSCNVRFQFDGTVWAQDDLLSGGTYEQVSVSTDWIIPNSVGGGGDYEIRFTKTAGLDPDQGDALNVWHDLIAANRRFGIQASADKTFETCTCLVEIRETVSQTVVASGTYTVASENT